MDLTYTLNINDKVVTTEAEETTTLLDVLRNDVGLKGTRFGCGEGLCGACFVLLDGRPVAACDTPVWSATGKLIRTVESLGSITKPHPLQTAFIEEQAMQCGYCISGILISSSALLEHNKNPTDTEIRQALDRHLCRCGAHNRIVRAIKRAAALMRSGR